MTKAGGYIGLATAGVAWYASFGGVVNETFKRAIVPPVPLAPAAPVGVTAARDPRSVEGGPPGARSVRPNGGP